MEFAAAARPARANLGALCLVAILGASCGGLGDEAAISDQPLAGTVNGQAWSIGTVTGQWDPYSAFGNEYSFTMYPCGAPADTDPLVVLVPGVVGTYAISSPGASSEQTSSTGSTSTYPSWQPYPSGSGGTTGIGSSIAAFFASGSRATGGRIAISGASATSVVGGADLTFGANSHLNGQFQAGICP